MKSKNNQFPEVGIVLLDGQRLIGGGKQGKFTEPEKRLKKAAYKREKHGMMLKVITTFVK